MAINAKTNNAIKTLALTNDISNPNLLINPDFKINQRGQSTYSISQDSCYTVDRWKLWNGTLTVNSDGTVTFKNLNGQAASFIQLLENPCTEECYASVYVTSITGTFNLYTEDSSDKYTGYTKLKYGLNYARFTGCKAFAIGINDGNGSITLKYAKLEKGTNVTQFIEPDRATELIKCQRYYLIASHPVVAMCLNYTNPTMLFVECMGLKNMRTSPTTIVTGSNKTTYLRYDGTATEGLSIDTSKVSANYDTGMYKIQFTKGTIPNAQNKPIAIDINDVRFRFDAEIY